MPTPKQSVQAMLRDLPDDASFEDIRLQILDLKSAAETVPEFRYATLEELMEILENSRERCQPVLDYLKDK